MNEPEIWIRLAAGLAAARTPDDSIGDIATGADQLLSEFTKRFELDPDYDDALNEQWERK